MFGMILMVGIIAVLVGLSAKFVLDKIGHEFEITWKEFWVTTAVIVLLAAPGFSLIGWEIAKGNKIAYNEYWNGWETGAHVEKIRCERDGNCKHDYDCDPYLVPVPHQSCDSKGSCTTDITYETRYHSCPYVDEERTYTVSTTLGGYVISSHRFPDNPQAHRFRRHERIPESVISSAGTGEPSFWKAAKGRIDSGKPGPVTARREYKNYLYASEKTILKQYSGEVDRYKKLNLLPRLQSGIFDFYLANKVYFVGYRPKDAKDWQERLGRLNAAFGSGLQGDLHVVVVQDETISSNPDAYAIALKAYWQNPVEFGKDTMSKNGTVVVLGTGDGMTVSWARAFTGMPIGNESMVTAMGSKLKGVSLAPDTILGDVYGVIAKGTDVGVLGDVLFGISDQESRFRRVGMSGNGSGSGTGFLYLQGEIQPTESQKQVVFVFVALFCSLGWLVAVFLGTRGGRNSFRNWR